MPRRTSILLLFVLASAGSAAAGDLGLVAVSPRSPWTLRELQQAHADIATYDPDTGVAFVVADAREERRLVELGFAVATAEPDLHAGLRAAQGPLDLGLYHTYAETVAELDSFQARYPNLCRVEVLGQTLEGRDIPALLVSDDPYVDDPAEPEVLLVGCHHAREFMSVEAPLHLARTLLEGYGVSPQVTSLVDTRAIWIVPLLNPDGHVFQQEFQASPEWERPGWRKNRRPNGDGSIGTDLNRNYGYRWGYDGEGSSAEGTDETYRGVGPFSELETQALRRLVERRHFVLSVSYHSFGGLVLYPWGFTRAQFTDDQPLFAALGDSMVRSNGYHPGNAALGTIYLTNGELGDWLYGEVTARKPTRTLPFTVELNTAGQGGFWPPDTLIAPTCAAVLPLDLFVLRVADKPRAPLPPPPPVVAGHQDPIDGRRIRLDWTQPTDEDNPVARYEVFEIAFTDPAVRDAAAVTLSGTGRVLLASRLPRPAGGAVVLGLDAELEPLWDYAYVEARGSDGAWRTLPGDATRTLSPTGRNRGDGLTGPFVARRLRFRLDAVPGNRIDLALRVDADRDSPRRPGANARLDLAATYGEERRVLDPEVHGTSYDVVAERPGIFAYGVTAVDADGQKSDSDIAFFVVPVTAVEVSDVRLRQDAGRLELRWRNLASGAARFEAWSRQRAAGEALRDAVGEWQRGDYTRVAALASPTDGDAVLVWDAPPGESVVLLRGLDADGERVWGPWSAALPAVTRLDPPVPNPFNPTTTLAVQLATEGRAVLDVFAPGGACVRRLLDARLPAGRHAVVWDGRDDAGRPLASGVYWVRLRAGGGVDTRRVVLLK